MNEANNKNGLVAAFSSYVKQHNLRQTYERLSIVKAIEAMHTPFDVETLTSLIKDNGGNTCRATVYNTISLLLKASLLRKIVAHDGHCTYESVALFPSGNKIHTICTHCGKVAIVKNSTVSKELRNISFGQFLTEYFSLNIYGICSKCQRRIRSERHGNTTQLKLFK